MSDRIEQALTKLFERHRIVFWYDTKRELRDDFEALELPDIKIAKLELVNNEFSLKYRILREEPKQKFLLYHEGPEPVHLDNWLLDVQLAQGKFSTDQIALWLSEIDLCIVTFYFGMMCSLWNATLSTTIRQARFDLPRICREVRVSS